MIHISIRKTQGVRILRRAAIALAALGVAVLTTALAAVTPAMAAPPTTPPFTECPVLGFDTSCEILLVINSKGEPEAIRDPSQTPYDRVDDTLIGIVNESGAPVKHIKLSGPGIYGFDGDGLCSDVDTTGEPGFVPPPTACPFGPTGYEGPGTSFTVFNENEGEVNFTGPSGEGLPPGQSTYFSMEEAIEAFACGSEGCTSVPTIPPSIEAECFTEYRHSSVITTHTPGDLILAYVAANGPKSGGQTATVSGGGLSWSLVKRENGQPGDAEVWEAVAPGTLNKAAISVSVSEPGYNAALDVVAYKNAEGVGNVAGFSALGGEPHGSLTTTVGGSQVYAVGDDWDESVPRTVGAGQKLLGELFDTVGDTYWVQTTNSPTPVAGTSVTINDTAPTKDRYDMVLVEVK